MSESAEVDSLLAAAFRGATPEWEFEGAATVDMESVCVTRALYHGIAALLVERADELMEVRWPRGVIAALRQQAVAQAMWELRHRIVLTQLVRALRRSGITPLILKGTAVAYDLYPNPAWRSRGDTDLLISWSDVEPVRNVMRQIGYVSEREKLGRAAPSQLQESWNLGISDRGLHQMDLHWDMLNSWALKDLLSYDEASANPLFLPTLCEGAVTPGRVLTLIHACLHRAQHVFAPYTVDGILYYGGDRLIWLYDIDLLARALSSEQWDELCELAVTKGVAGLCFDGLEAAAAQLGTPYPTVIRTRLSLAKRHTAAGRYLESPLVARAWQDWRALPGLDMKLADMFWRLFPPARFMRAKYPDIADRWLPLLYARRNFSFVRGARTSKRRSPK